MYDREDLEQLVRAARDAASKMKIEYDLLQPDAEPQECWAETETLWDALLPFADVGRDVSMTATTSPTIVQEMDEIIRTLERTVKTLREKVADDA